MIISLDQAKQIIDLPLAKLILESVLSGFKDYSDSLSDQTRAICSATTRASFINDHMIHHAREKMQGYPQVQFIKRYGRYHLLVDGQVEIKLKKLGCNRMPSNIPTNEVREYNTQIPLLIPQPSIPQQLEFPNMRKTMANLIAGYQINRNRERVAVYIVCPLGSRNRWEWELDFVPELVAPQPTEVSLKPKIVVAKKKQMAREQTDQRRAYAESSGTIQS